MQDVQEKRDVKSVLGGLKLHQYANLYFHARNPMLYVGLLNDARTFAAIGDYARDPQSTNQVSVTDFILRMDNEMKKANDIAVAFDATKGPVYNLSDKVPK